MGYALTVIAVKKRNGKQIVKSYSDVDATSEHDARLLLLRMLVRKGYKVVKITKGVINDAER